MNETFVKLLDLKKKNNVIGKTDIDILPEGFAKTCLYGDMIVLNTKKPFTEIDLLEKKGKQIYIEINKIPVIDENNNLIGILGIVRDISGEIQLQKEIEVLKENLQKSKQNEILIKECDITTNLPNRKKFIEVLKEELNSLKNLNIESYIILISIENFNYLKKLFTERVIERYFKMVSSQIKFLLKKENIHHIFSRTGENQFTLLVKGKVNIKNLIQIVENILKNPSLKDKKEGKVLVPDILFAVKKINSPFDPEKLILTLEESVKNLKLNISSNNIIFLPETKQSYENARLLSTAIKTKNILPYIQGIYSTKTKELLGYEVLFRVKHNGKLIEAQDLLLTANETGLIRFIDEHILDKINKLNKNIDKKLFINISSLTLFNCETNRIIDLIVNLREKVSFEVSEIEIVESIRVLKKIAKKYNINFSWNGFSFNTSPIRLIMDLYNDKITTLIKLDRNIIVNLTKIPENEKIVKAITDISNEFNIKTVAVGVENKEIFEKVSSLNIHYCQGYYFEHPKEISQIIKS